MHSTSDIDTVISVGSMSKYRPIYDHPTAARLWNRRLTCDFTGSALLNGDVSVLAWAVLDGAQESARSKPRRRSVGPR